MAKYELNVVSYHQDSNNKILKKYHVDGIDTIGAFGSENFGIRFKNNTSEMVQVKISLDGTDILTGELADTNISNNMWVVQPYETLELNGWPESSSGGARFVFTNIANGVATHTHGNLSHRGIIAAAVFTERNKPNRRGYRVGYSPDILRDIKSSKSYDSKFVYGSASMDSMDIITDITTPTMSYNSTTNCCVNPNTSVQAVKSSSTILDNSLVAIGAGEYVNQQITYVSGLANPKLSETIKIRFVWYDDLVQKLKNRTIAEAQSSGFPGDFEHKHIDLGSTPRIKETVKKEWPYFNPNLNCDRSF